MQKVIPTDAALIPDQAKRVFEGQIFDVYQWPQTMFDGSSSTFEMLKRPDTVAAICLVNDQILVLDDDQPHFGSRQSFPSGRVEPDDASIEAAAWREVLEETGYAFKKWRLLKVQQPHLKIEWFVYLWLAWEQDGAKQPPNLDAGEKITLHEISFDELKDLVLNKAGYLGESLSAMEDVQSADQLLSLPEFSGQTVDR